MRIRPRHPILKAAACVPALLSAVVAAADDAEPAAVAVIARYCVDCHSGESAEAEVDLDFSADGRLAAFTADAGGLRLALTRLKNREMPPRDAEQPTDAERDAAAAWLAGVAREAACAAADGPTPAPIRRLNRTQYRATVRDLLGIDFPAGEGLPADGGGADGFDNAAETLYLSPVHAEKYLDAARSALDYAARAAVTKDALFHARPGTGDLDERDAADRNLWKLMRRAFRRDVTWDERQSYLALYDAARADGAGYEEAVLHAMSAVLVSPHFLFRVEQPSESGAGRVDGRTLAERLSYFLWTSMPDDRLRHRAAHGGLDDAAGVRGEVARMLADPKVERFAADFTGQWLGTRELGESFRPNKTLFPEFTDYTAEMLRTEPALLFADMLREDAPLTDLIDADYTYLTKDTAKHYGLLEALKPVQDRPKRFTLPEGDVRGGVLTMGAVLAVTSHPTRTSPVVRGKWVLETLLGDPPPPPPPDVPDLPESAAAKPSTLREQLAAHRADAACASCHDRIDPLGFGLENFDAVGRWRDEEAGVPVDATGTPPGGVTFDGPEGLKRYLLGRKEDFVRNLAGKMLSYALGRGLTDADLCAVETIVTRVAAADYSTRELVFAVVESDPFLAAPAAP